MSAQATHGAGNAREFPQTGRSMKHKSGDRPLTVEEYHRECLRAVKLPLGKGVSGRGSRLRRRGRKAVKERQGRTLWDRLRVR